MITYFSLATRLVTISRLIKGRAGSWSIVSIALDVQGALAARNQDPGYSRRVGLVFVSDVSNSDVVAAQT